MNLDAAGVIRRELEQRVTLSADREDDAVALEVVDSALDLLACHVRIAEPLVDLAVGEQAIALLPQQFDDSLFEL